METAQSANLPRGPHGRRKLGRPRLLIIGCGDVGLRIVSRLFTRFRVIALTSTPARVAQLRAAGAVAIVGDLDRRESLRRLRGIAQRVMHLAPPGESGSTDARTRRLAALLAPTIERAVYISTTGVYGDHGGALIDETARLRPANTRALRRIDAEQTMRHSLHASVLRVPGIYAHDRLPLDRLRKGVPALIEPDDVHTNHIHADDLARITIAALARGAPARIYNAVDDSALKMADYFDAVAHATSLPRPPRLPRAEVRAALSPIAYSFFTESRRLANRRLKRELRVSLSYPTVASTLATLAAEKTNGPGGAVGMMRGTSPLVSGAAETTRTGTIRRLIRRDFGEPVFALTFCRKMNRDPNRDQFLNDLRLPGHAHRCLEQVKSRAGFTRHCDIDESGFVSNWFAPLCG